VRGAFCQSAKKIAAALAQSPKIGGFNKKYLHWDWKNVK
jgi:hypothetical protein